ncbi:metallophosphoesterase [bacterium]|nr:metallophosphoesterase [bacterium]
MSRDERVRWIAVAGDVHGEIDELASLLARFEEATGHPVDLLLQVGDLEPHRFDRDLESLCMPEKRRSVGDFPLYAKGEKKLPCEVVFIGGNHEPWSFLEEHANGGEIAPGFTFLGRSGRVERFGLRIGGLSGIYNAAHSERPRSPRFEKRRATYFVRDEVALLLNGGPLDVLLVHEWPEGILEDRERGILPTLLRRSSVGNAPARLLVDRLAPPWVFCGHLHVAHRRDLSQDGRSVRVRCCAAVPGEDPEAVVFLKWDGRSLEETASLAELEALAGAGARAKATRAKERPSSSKNENAAALGEGAAP